MGRGKREEKRGEEGRKISEMWRTREEERGKRKG